MNMNYPLWPSGEVGPAIIIAALVELVPKGYGLWHAARNSQKWWFIALMIINSLGILPLVYLLFFRPKEGIATPKKSSLARKRK